MRELAVHDPNHANHITDPCRWVYANGRECGLSQDAHHRNGRLWHLWTAERRSDPLCVQCGARVTGWGKMWPTGATSCAKCYWADFG